MEHTQSCHRSDDLCFWFADRGDVAILVDFKQSREDSEHCEDESSVEAMTKVLPAKKRADEECSAKEDGHEHFGRGSRGIEGIPFEEASEAKDDEADAIQDSKEHADHYL